MHSGGGAFIRCAPAGINQMKEGVYMSEDSKISKAQQKAVHKYVKNNYDRIELTVKPKGKKEDIKAHAEKNGETLNSFINRAIDETMSRDILPDKEE